MSLHLLYSQKVKSRLSFTRSEISILFSLFIHFFVAGLTSKKARTNQSARPRSRDQRAEMKQKKYRYLYQVRTAHGDVISQVSNFFVFACGKKKTAHPIVVYL